MVFDDTQKWFAQRQVELGRGPRFYQPPIFKARVNDIAKMARDTHRAVPSHGPVQSALMLGGLAAGLALAGYGYYILIYIV